MREEKKAFYKVAILEDDEICLKRLSGSLEVLGYKSFSHTRVDELICFLSSNKVDIILSDVVLEEECGIDILKKMESLDLDLPVIFMTSSNNIELAVKAIKSGASDYFNKSFTMEELDRKIKKSLHFHQLNSKQSARNEENLGPIPYVVGRSEKMQKIGKMVEDISSVNATVLLTGESGTGKEVFAKIIHENSPKKNHPFRAINCGSIPAELIESELFGHVKGSFTGSNKDRKGIFVEASEGTLLLDEIGDMPLDMQCKLLRVLQEKQVKPIGSDAVIKINTRIIAATNKDLKELIKEGLFREDLYFFFDKFIKKYNRGNLKKYSENAMTEMFSYHWPGNVRELENTIERAVILSEGTEIKTLSIAYDETQESSEGLIQSVGKKTFSKLVDVEKKYIEEVLISTSWDVKKAADIAGIGWRSFYRKMESHQILPENKKDKVISITKES